MIPPIKMNRITIYQR